MVELLFQVSLPARLNSSMLITLSLDTGIGMTPEELTTNLVCDHLVTCIVNDLHVTVGNTRKIRNI